MIYTDDESKIKFFWGGEGGGGGGEVKEVERKPGGSAGCFQDSIEYTK